MKLEEVVAIEILGKETWRFTGEVVECEKRERNRAGEITTTWNTIVNVKGADGSYLGSLALGEPLIVGDKVTVVIEHEDPF